MGELNSLQGSVIRTFDSPELQRIRPVKYKSLIVRPGHYKLLVGAFLMTGKPEIIYNPNISHSYYHSGANKFKFRFERAESVTQKAIVVHEGVHAIFDMLPVNSLEKYSEAVAYIVQCQYAMIINPSGGRLESGETDAEAYKLDDLKYVAAWNAAKKLQADSELTEEDIENVAEAVAKDPDYSGSCNDETSYNGLFE